jgi:hypothetical protein
VVPLVGAAILGLVEVPECRRLAPELFCQPRSGFAGFEDRFQAAAQRVELEITVLASRYEISPPSARTRSGCAASSLPPSSPG